MSPQPDFLRPARRPQRLVWAALVVTVGAALSLAALDARDQALERETALRKKPAAKTAQAQPQRDDKADRAAARDLARLQRPWDQRLVAVEQLQQPGLAWLLLDIGQQGLLRLEGTVRNAASANAAAAALRSGGAVWQAVLLQRVEAAADAPPRFEINASATPDVAAPRLPMWQIAGDQHQRGADLQALALRHGVQFVRTQQRLDDDKSALQMAVSARGRYPDLRGFIEAALAADPGLALDGLQLRRADAQTSELEAQLQWALLARAPEAHAPRHPWPMSAGLLAWGPPLPAAAPASLAKAAAATPQRAPLPPFPYRWIGRFDDGGGPQALLSGPLRSVGVRAGDVLDGDWRVEQVAASQLMLTWLPGGDAVSVDFK